MQGIQDPNLKELCGVLQINENGYPGCELFETDYDDFDIDVSMRNKSDCGLVSIQSVIPNAFHHEHLKMVQASQASQATRAILWRVSCSKRLSIWDIVMVMHRLKSQKMDVVFLFQDEYWRISGQPTYMDFNVDKITTYINHERFQNNASLSAYMNDFFGDWIHFEVRDYNTESQAFTLPLIPKEKFERLAHQVALGTMISAVNTAIDRESQERTRFQAVEYTKNIIAGVAFTLVEESMSLFPIPPGIEVKRQFFRMTNQFAKIMPNVDQRTLEKLFLWASSQDLRPDINAIELFPDGFEGFVGQMGEVPQQTIESMLRSHSVGHDDPRVRGTFLASFTLGDFNNIVPIVKKLSQQENFDMTEDLKIWTKMVAFVAYYITSKELKVPREEFRRKAQAGDEGNERCHLSKVPVMLCDPHNIECVVTRMLQEIKALKWEFMTEDDRNDLEQGKSNTNHHDFPRGLWDQKKKRSRGDSEDSDGGGAGQGEQDEIPWTNDGKGYTRRSGSRTKKVVPRHQDTRRLITPSLPPPTASPAATSPAGDTAVARRTRRQSRQLRPYTPVAERTRNQLRPSTPVADRTRNNNIT